MIDCYASAATKNKDAGEKRLLRTRTTFSQSLMLTDGVLKLDHTGLIFVDPGLKVDGNYYCDLLLSQRLLLAIPQISGEFIFLQDMAQAYRAC